MNDLVSKLQKKIDSGFIPEDVKQAYMSAPAHSPILVKLTDDSISLVYRKTDSEGQQQTTSVFYTKEDAEKLLED